MTLPAARVLMSLRTTWHCQLASNRSAQGTVCIGNDQTEHYLLCACILGGGEGGRGLVAVLLFLFFCFCFVLLWIVVDSCSCSLAAQRLAASVAFACLH